MIYKIAIVEDVKKSRMKLEKYINKYAEENNEEFEVIHFSDGDEITSDYEAIYDIIFLDIEMKRLDGMSAAEKIRDFDKDVTIIFITNMSQYAIKGYSVDALNFLLKPVSYFVFSQELKRSIERIKSRENKFVILPTSKGKAKVKVTELLYIESFKHKLFFYTKSSEYTTYGTMKDMEKDLLSANFYRCNNCYLVNLAMVQGIEGEFAIVGSHKLKISRPRKKDFMEALASYAGRTLV
ncbi:LytR/AlgR family response regulator transcription factor [Haloplasma contractile]|uniref:DNA-binding response regulator LytTr family protein n=1 Tax=Haloplasma contractile SSD-17B TaxID=1033810 RepID=F7PU08_9MOLU|nr:LytTR family DNA-binding domain-containing protein [Haloplasma contractile]ERJ12260.1 DNA-binding response regulator LytTr family protein [Haloplasma contractile SSD-17B]